MGAFMKTSAIVVLVLAVFLKASGGVPPAVNQAGYPRQSGKYVYTSQRADSFTVISAVNRMVLMRGPFTLLQSSDPATGLAIYGGDFSAVRHPGVCRVLTSGGDSSALFAIGDSVYDGVYRKALKGFYFQRCGVALLPAWAGVYQHPACHVGDGTYHSTADTSGFHPATGGWHDAGDYGKYVVNAGISVGTLLMAYEDHTASFAQDDLGIPESGNGVPDILDEVRFELQWLLTMQRSNGGVCTKLTRTQFEGFVMPQNDTGTRYLYQIASTATADFAAMMARAARVYQPFDAVFAQTCVNAATSAWAYLDAHPQIVPTGGFTNPSGTATGEYGDANDSDERLWAAAELFATTGTPAYQTYYLLNAGSAGSAFAGLSWPNVRALANLTYLKTNRGGMNETVRSDLRQALVSFCQTLVGKRNSSGYHVVLQPGEYYWGSNSNALNAAMLLLAGYSESGTRTFLDAASDQLHYILGANAHALSFVTGVGSRATRHPHHRPSESDGVADPVPGLLAGGPNQYGGDPALNSAFSSSTPPALWYLDTVASYASNEICINWNAPLVFVAGCLNAQALTSVGEFRGGKPEGDLHLKQNFPNPFNGTTTIIFSLGSKEAVVLKVFDMLGRTIVMTAMGEFPPGEHRFSWHAADRYGRPLSSGVYLYSLTGRTMSGFHKLILLN
jgi:endoglucanase